MLLYMSCICMYIPNIVKLSVLHFWEHLRPKDQLKRNFSAIIKDITVLYCNIETLHLLQVIVPFSTFVPPTSPFVFFQLLNGLLLYLWVFHKHPYGF